MNRMDGKSNERAVNRRFSIKNKGVAHFVIHDGSHAHYAHMNIILGVTHVKFLDMARGSLHSWRVPLHRCLQLAIEVPRILLLLKALS